MKAQFLKIAGAKNEADFYKMFPTEEAFMAKHGAKVKKLQKAQNGIQYDQFGNPVQKNPPVNIPGMPGSPQQGHLYGSAFGGQQPPYSLPYDTSWQGDTPIFTPKKNEFLEGMQNAEVTSDSPKDITSTPFNTDKAIETGIGMVDSVVGGIKALKAEKKALKSARTWRDVSSIARRASETEDVNKRQVLTDNQRRLRKALIPTITGEELFPVTGVGTNVLARYGGYMQGGGEIQNTFAPEDIYADGGFEPMGESEYQGFTPLPDREIIKAYRAGGLVPRAQFGFDTFAKTLGGANANNPWNVGGNIGASLVGAATGNNAGSQIGGGFGKAAGMFFGMPGVGEAVGSFIGGVVDRNPQRTAKADKARMTNVNAMSGMQGLRQYWGGYNSVAEEGGNLTNPQLFTSFNGVTPRDFKRHFDDMDTLRTGGNIRSNQVGDIQIDDRGRLEPISYNPYTAGTGVTSMIKGPSHDRGGTNVSYNGNMVEAEGGEPITERQEGGSVGDTSAVITGDQTFNKVGAHEIPELSEYLGKKVKKIHADLAQKDAKLNKMQTKNSVALSEFNPITPIDKLTFNSLTMNEKGIGEQYKRNALKTESLIAYQDAINQEAESRGLDAGELSRGKVKPLPPEEMQMAKYGLSLLTKAQYGGKTREQYLKERGEAMGGGGGSTVSEQRAMHKKALEAQAEQDRLVNWVRSQQSLRPQGKAIYPQVSPNYEAEQARKKEASDKALNEMLKTGQGVFNPNVDLNNPPKVAAKKTTTAAVTKTAATPATKTAARANAITQATGTPTVTTATKATASRANVPSGTTVKVSKSQAAPKQKEATVPNTKDLPPLSEESYNELLALYKEAEKYPNKKSDATLKFQKRYHELAKDYAHAVLASEPVTEHGKRTKVSNKDLASNEDAIFGKRTRQYLAALKKAEPVKPATPAETLPADQPVKSVPDEDGVYETTPYKKYWWENLAPQIMPWLKKTPGEPLLGDQLAGEMYAMATNKEEPVQARFYQPQLDVPYDISYQDRLNENQATFNRLERAAGAGNPEALSMLAGQKYAGDSNVLAEQFRANQAKKDQVYSQNRATLNQAQMTNLGLADQQYVRQQQAKSNTKLAMQEALNSVAAKIGQNRLENRTLQTYANMFPDFSFGKDYNIRKTGAPTSFNMPVVYNAAGDITHVALYDSDGKIYDYRPITAQEQKTMGSAKKDKAAPTTTPAPAEDTAKKKERNGGIVRAFKNL